MAVDMADTAVDMADTAVGTVGMGMADTVADTAAGTVDMGGGYGHGCGRGYD